MGKIHYKPNTMEINADMLLKRVIYMKRRVSGSKSKDGFRYPILRLPREFEWLIGKEVEIEFRTIDNRKALDDLCVCG